MLQAACSDAYESGQLSRPHVPLAYSAPTQGCLLRAYSERKQFLPMRFPEFLKYECAQSYKGRKDSYSTQTGEEASLSMKFATRRTEYHSQSTKRYWTMSFVDSGLAVSASNARQHAVRRLGRVDWDLPTRNCRLGGLPTMIHS